MQRVCPSPACPEAVAPRVSTILHRDIGNAGCCCLETCGILLTIRGRNEGSVSQQYFTFLVLLPITFFFKLRFISGSTGGYFRRTIFHRGLNNSMQGSLHCKDYFPQLCTGTSTMQRSLPCCLAKMRINEAHLPTSFQGNWEKGRRSLLV